uniref:Membrane-spanning 4-domains subfamily A member 8-like n=1 Tax=Salvator merianae TaxID=96440 RepID=A0A8D0B898_SALMN
MASGTVMFIPQNGTSVFIGGQPIPSTVIQPAGTVQYVQYVGQPVGSAINQPQQSVPETALQKFLKVETKTLGAIQIMIGLIHIGFGAVSAVLSSRYYISLATIGGYPFWGGLFFIISGSLSVSVEKNLTSSLVQCSVGLNITSAVMALIGIILYCAEFSIFSFLPDPGDWHNYASQSMHTGLSVLLFLFSLLEFCIAVSTAHFGCKATCCKNDPETIAVPYVISGTTMTPAQGNPATAPPPYCDSADVPTKIE